VAGGSGGGQFGYNTYLFQSIDGTLENARGLPPEFARDRIVDQDRLLIFGYLSSITSL
jgi:hypothetical protein